MAKRIAPKAQPENVGTLYPPPFDKPCRARGRTKLGDVAGLTQFGVNQLRLPPGTWSSQRHWHTREDEFVYVLSGEVVLVTDAGIVAAGQLLRRARHGDCRHREIVRFVEQVIRLQGQAERRHQDQGHAYGQ